MRGNYVDAAVAAPNEFTPALTVQQGGKVAVSVVPTGFAGTVFLQRSLTGDTWFDVQSWEDSGVQASYDAEVHQLLRLGVPTGSFSLGAVYLRLESQT